MKILHKKKKVMGNGLQVATTEQAQAQG